MIVSKYFPVVGGWNQEDPPLASSPGEMIDVNNYECMVGGGIRRISGYTLYDGQSTPSQAVPGTGNVLGVHVYKGDVYAVRDDGSNGRLYKATASGWVEVDNTFTWTSGGSYYFTNYNFYGQDAQEEMFIVNGIDKAVKYDGTSLVQLTTGTGSDNPKVVAGYQKHLFLGIESSLVNSAIGNPTDYTALNGAGEIAVGDTITDLQTGPSALIVGCQDSTNVLYGSSTSDFELDELNKVGSYTNTLGSIGGLVVGLDTQGVMSLQAAQTYGNFSYASISQKVKTYVNLYFGEGAVSVPNRKLSQYRLFNEKAGLYFTFSGPDMIGVTRVNFAHPVKCAVNSTDTNQVEVSYFGDDQGYVYKMDDGYSFNGTDIYSYFITSFHHYGGPTTNKRFRLIQPDLRVTGANSQVGVRAITDYGDGNVSLGYTEELVQTGGSLWDFSTWDQFIYDSAYHQDSRIRVSLTGTNLAVMISSDGSDASQHTIYGITVHYSPRRLIR